MTHAEDGDVMPLSVEKRCVLMHDEVDAEAQDQPLCKKADFQTHGWASPASLQHFSDTLHRLAVVSTKRVEISIPREHSAAYKRSLPHLLSSLKNPRTIRKRVESIPRDSKELLHIQRFCGDAKGIIYPP